MANDDLTLDQLIAQAKSANITKQQDQILQNNASTSTDVSEADDKKFQQPKQSYLKTKKKSPAKTQKQKPCYKCSTQPSHHPYRCPAKDATCNLCKMKGHYAKVCKFSKRVQRVDNDSEHDISAMTIGTSVNTIASSKKWQTNLVNEKTAINFKFDTGADVTVTPKDIFHQHRLGHLQGTSKTLYMVDQTGL